MTTDTVKQSWLSKLASANRIFVVYTMCSFANQFSYGMNMNMIGAALVDLRFIYETSVDTISFAPNLINLGYMLGSLTGWLYKWINRQLTISIILSLLGVIIAMFPHCGAIAFLFVISVINGMGCGAWDSSSSIWLVEMWPKGNSALLQISQSMYGLGSILGPLLISPFLHGEVNSTIADNPGNLTNITTTTAEPLDLSLPVTPHDRIVSLTIPFLIVGIVQFSAPALMFILFFTNRYKRPSSSFGKEPFIVKNARSGSVCSESFKKSHNKVLDVQNIKYRYLKLALVNLSIGCYSAAESNYFFFSPSMFQYLEINMSASESANLLSIMCTTFCIGRVVAGIVSIKVKPDILVFVHYVIALVSTLILLIGQNSRLWIYIGTAAIGAGFSAMWPAILAFTERHLQLTDRIGSIFSFSVGFLALITPLVLSSIFRSNPIILLILTGAFILVSLCSFIVVNVLIWIF